ncbi:hypothetical protein GGF37_003339, partial [Kickxella alabastrina]
SSNLSLLTAATNSVWMPLHNLTMPVGAELTITSVITARKRSSAISKLLKWGFTMWTGYTIREKLRRWYDGDLLIPRRVAMHVVIMVALHTVWRPGSKPRFKVCMPYTKTQRDL